MSALLNVIGSLFLPRNIPKSLVSKLVVRQYIRRRCSRELATPIRSKHLAISFSALTALTCGLGIWLLNGGFFGSERINYYAEGQNDARAELATGQLRMKDGAADSITDRRYREILENAHGIAYDKLLPKSDQKELAEYNCGYNDVMEPAIEKQLGYSILDHVRKNAAHEFQETTEIAEYEVYSTVLAEIEQNARVVFVIGSETWDRLSNLDPEVYSRFELETLVEEQNIPPLFPLSQSRREAVEDYKTKNENPVKLKAKFEVKPECLLLSDRAFHTFFSGPPVYKSIMDGWQKYYKRYPTSRGYIRLSRIGFNREMTEALIYVELDCGELCAYGRFKLLSKEGDRWSIKNSIQFYAS